MNNQNTIVITSIYKEFWGTDEFYKSCKRVGFPVHNAHTPNRPFTGNGDAIANIYKALKLLKEQGYTHAIYSDGADSIFLRQFIVPDYILYSTEKAIWEPIPQLVGEWDNYYSNIELFWGSKLKSPWKYLNGGGYCGPINLLIEFFEKYGLSELKGDVPAQSKQAFAYLKAFNDKINIHLDVNCEIFQTTGFEDPGDFALYPDYFKNNITNTLPSVLHGNGRTGMQHLYKLYNK